MCGIVGQVEHRGIVDPAGLVAMRDALEHRGPDDAGSWLSADGRVGLGHRRLSIVDLSEGGAQPMVDNGGQFVLTYNGEIYNYLEIRKELTSLGAHFRSRSDSEVILEAYKQWGSDCLSRFNGMFAFAIWDRNQQRLLLARDRYGIKPLYYAFFDDCFLFASEQKPILTHPSVKKQLDLEAVLEYFTFQNLFTDKTFFKGIHLFPPAAPALAHFPLVAGRGDRAADTQLPLVHPDKLPPLLLRRLIPRELRGARTPTVVPLPRSW